MFSFGRTRLIILSHILSFSSFHIGFLCLWCFCAVISLYDANNAFIFSISLVIKKVFSCSIILESTFYNVSPLWNEI